MEVMEASLDLLYKRLKANNEYIPEYVLAQIAFSVSIFFHTFDEAHDECLINMRVVVKDVRGA